MKKQTAYIIHAKQQQAVETDEHREKRLEKRRQYKKRHKSIESDEQKQQRLARDRERKRIRCKNETENEKQLKGFSQISNTETINVTVKLLRRSKKDLSQINNIQK